MRTVSIFKSSRNQAIRIPKDMEFQGISELEIIREGETLILRPVRPSWSSLRDVLPVDSDFLAERQDVIEDGRFLSDSRERLAALGGTMPEMEDIPRRRRPPKA